MRRTLGVVAGLAIAWHAGAEQAAHAPQAGFSREEVIAGARAAFGPHLHRMQVAQTSSRQRAQLAKRGNAVMRRVIAAAMHQGAPPGEWHWRLVVMDLGENPPFAMPDGQIFIAAPWVRRLRLTDAELTFVIAHEVAHVLAEHMRARLSALAAARPAARLTAVDALRMVGEEWWLMDELQSLVRTQELEADRRGVALACAAGVSPARALSLFDKTAAREPSSGGLALHRTHPGAAERKTRLVNWLVEQPAGCAY